MNDRLLWFFFSNYCIHEYTLPLNWIIFNSASPCPSRENSQESIATEEESQPKEDQQQGGDGGNEITKKKQSTSDVVDGVSVGSTPSKLVITDIGRATVKGY